MANNRHFYGFRYYANLAGGGIPPAFEGIVATAYQANVDSQDVDINIGDPIERVTDGSFRLAGDGSVDPGQFFGVCAGFSNAKVDSNARSRPSPFLPGGTTHTTTASQSRILIQPFGRCLWEIDVDDNTTATTEAAYRALCGLNTPLIYSADVANTDRPKANPLIDISTTGTGTDHFRIMEISKTAENVDLSGTFVKLLVMINEGLEPVHNLTGI